MGKAYHVLASLNHPHIASIYGLEESDTTRALVMELDDASIRNTASSIASMRLNSSCFNAAITTMLDERAPERGFAP